MSSELTREEIEKLNKSHQAIIEAAKAYHESLVLEAKGFARSLSDQLAHKYSVTKSVNINGEPYVVVFSLMPQSAYRKSVQLKQQKPAQVNPQGISELEYCGGVEGGPNTGPVIETDPGIKAVDRGCVIDSEPR